MNEMLQIFSEPDSSDEVLRHDLIGEQLDADSGLTTILAAWNEATDRLQKTHEVLQAEVSRLTDELAEKNRELARKNRLADLGHMAAHVAHEVRNSLVPVTLYLSLLKRRLLDNPESFGILTKMEAGFNTLDTTVNDLLNFTTDRTPQRQPFALGELVSEICDALGPQLEAQSIRLEIDIDAGSHLVADREMIRRSLLNLTLNALDAMPNGGELVFTAVETPAGLDIEVADSGPGLQQQQLQQMFEPFYSTKATGTGLGLAIVQRIAEAHGGRVTATNCPEGGAAFTLELPRQAQRMAA